MYPGPNLLLNVGNNVRRSNSENGAPKEYGSSTDLLEYQRAYYLNPGYVLLECHHARFHLQFVAFIVEVHQNR